MACSGTGLKKDGQGHLFPLNVTCLDVTETHFYRVSTLEVYVVNAVDDKRIVKEFRFLGWPKDSFPKHADLLEFLQLVNEWAGRSKPKVVHCSDGSTRCGTLVALDIQCHRLWEQRYVNVAEGVIRLFRERLGFSLRQSILPSSIGHWLLHMLKSYMSRQDLLTGDNFTVQSYVFIFQPCVFLLKILLKENRTPKS